MLYEQYPSKLIHDPRIQKKYFQMEVNLVSLFTILISFNFNYNNNDKNNNNNDNDKNNKKKYVPVWFKYNFFFIK